jgi:hypothetical protein
MLDLLIFKTNFIFTIQKITLLNNQTKGKSKNTNNTLMLKKYQINIIYKWKDFMKIISLPRVQDFGGDRRNKFKKFNKFYGFLFFDLLCLTLYYNFLSETVIKC